MKPYLWRRQLLRTSSLPPLTRLVGLAVAERCDERGQCHPSHSTLAADTGMHRVTVVRHLAVLRDAGWLLVTNRANQHGTQTNAYLLISPVDNYLEGDLEGGTPVAQDYRGGSTALHRGVLHSATQKKSPIEEEGHLAAPNPQDPHLAAVISLIGRGTEL